MCAGRYRSKHHLRKLAKVVTFVNLKVINSEALLCYNQLMSVCVFFLLPFYHTCSKTSLISFNLMAQAAASSRRGPMWRDVSIRARVAWASSRRSSKCSVLLWLKHTRPLFLKFSKVRTCKQKAIRTKLLAELHSVFCKISTIADKA